MIANALTMGIGKRQLLEDYYFDELSPLMKEWNSIHGADGGEPETVDPLSFMGEGGEWL